MGKKYEKITIKVSAQTAYHLDRLSRCGQCSIGRVVDKLVRERMVSERCRDWIAGSRPGREEDLD